jgi:hypothetical protein
VFCLVESEDIRKGERKKQQYPKLDNDTVRVGKEGMYDIINSQT